MVKDNWASFDLPHLEGPAHHRALLRSSTFLDLSRIFSSCNNTTLIQNPSIMQERKGTGQFVLAKACKSS